MPSAYYKCPLTDRCIGKTTKKGCVFMERCAHLKRTEILAHATPCMKQKDVIILNKIYQIQKDKCVWPLYIRLLKEVKFTG